MLFHHIFHMTWVKKPKPRSRRALAGLRLHWEPLEDRAPLSSGLGVDLGVTVVSQQVEIGVISPGVALVSGWAAVGADGVDQAIRAGPSTSPVNVLPPELNRSAMAFPGKSEWLVTNGPIGFGVVPVPLTGSTSGTSGANAAGGSAVPPPAELPTTDGGDAVGSSEPPLAIDIVERDRFFAIAGLLMGPFLGRGVSNSNVDESAMSNAGPLPWLESSDVLFTWTATPWAASRGLLSASGFTGTGPSVQIDPNDESHGSSGLSYLGTGGWVTRLTEPLDLQRVDVVSVDEGSTEPVFPSSITGGGVPLSILLNGPDVPSPTESGGVEQVAELIPLPESSLALAATLWTVPSDSQTSRTRWDPPSGAAMGRAVPSASPSSWAVFLTGVDQAFEQTCHDVRESIHSSNRRLTETEGPSGGPDGQLEWQGPILPAAQGGLTSLLPGDARGDSTSQTQEETQPQLDEGQPVLCWATPMLSVVSMSTFVVGCFWRKRRRGRQLGLGCSSSTRRSSGRPARPE
jgi:hypothetical protein